MPSPIISIKSASVIYGEHVGAPQKALDNISLDIFPNEFIIFFGPSGCGKSTLLYSIAGLEQLSSGSIHSNGFELSKLTIKDAVTYHRSTIGMVFQAYYLISTLTSLQNVTLPQVFTSKSKKLREEGAMHFLKRFGIGDHADMFPNQLSGGQQQRVAIARALINNAPILLADEPVGNLDSKAADSVLEVFTELKLKDRKTIIMVTHNPNHLKFADRVFYMRDGKIIREVANTPIEEKEKKEQEQEVRPAINHGLQDFAKIFPHLEEDQLKAKMVTWHLLNELDIQAEQRLEKIVSDYLKRNISIEQFIAIATMPVRKSGIGLYHPFAERIAQKLNRISAMSEYMLKHFQAYPDSYEQYQIILDQVTTYLFEITEYKPTQELLARMQSIVKSRLEGSLGHDGFMALLDKPYAQGGAGLNVRTARNVARQLEMILMHFDEMKRVASDKKSRAHLYGVKHKPEQLDIVKQQKKGSDIPAPIVVPKPPAAQMQPVLKVQHAVPAPVKAITATKAPVISAPPVPVEQTSTIPKLKPSPQSPQEHVRVQRSNGAPPSRNLLSSPPKVVSSPALHVDPVKKIQLQSIPLPQITEQNISIKKAVDSAPIPVPPPPSPVSVPLAPATSHVKSKSDLGRLESMLIQDLERMSQDLHQDSHRSFVIEEGTSRSSAPSPDALNQKTNLPQVIVPKPTSSVDVRSYAKPVRQPTRAQSVLPPKPPPRMYVPIEGMNESSHTPPENSKQVIRVTSSRNNELDAPTIIFADKTVDAQRERPRRIFTIQ